MAGIWVWCEIVCIKCSEAHAGRHVTDSRIPKRELIKEAKEGGWVFKDQDAYCHSCAVSYGLKADEPDEEIPYRGIHTLLQEMKDQSS
jgi:hypothetical protein